MEFESDFVEGISDRAPMPEEQKGKAFEKDPTILVLNVEKEELFESRSYRLQRSKESFLRLQEILAGYPAGAEVPGVVVQELEELIATCTIDLLAKRRKDDGLVSAVLVGVIRGKRGLISRLDWVQESQYRQAVEEFEASLPEGVLAEPQVVTVEEWYSHDLVKPNGVVFVEPEGPK